jgi:hypothetical protein
MSRRSLSIGGTCIHGHILTEQNIYKYPNGRLVCKVCRRKSNRKSMGLEPADPDQSIEEWIRDQYRQKLTCKHGHGLEDNTYITPSGHKKCKTCMYLSNRKRSLQNYTLTEEQFLEMWYQQDQKCAICMTPLTIKLSILEGETAQIDHDHACCPEKSKSCGKCLRELLCTNCNNGLGRFFDNPELLIAAANYIIKHKH